MSLSARASAVYTHIDELGQHIPSRTAGWIGRRIGAEPLPANARQRSLPSRVAAWLIAVDAAGVLAGAVLALVGHGPSIQCSGAQQCQAAALSSAAPSITIIGLVFAWLALGVRLRWRKARVGAWVVSLFSLLSVTGVAGQSAGEAIAAGILLTLPGLLLATPPALRDFRRAGEEPKALEVLLLPEVRQALRDEGKPVRRRNRKRGGRGRR